MGFGADTEGPPHGPGTPLPGFRSIAEGRGMAADREGDAGGTGPPPGGKQLEVSLAWV